MKYESIWKVFYKFLLFCRKLWFFFFFSKWGIKNYFGRIFSNIIALPTIYYLQMFKVWFRNCWCSLMYLAVLTNCNLPLKPVELISYRICTVSCFGYRIQFSSSGGKSLLIASLHIQANNWGKKHGVLFKKSLKW